MLRGIFISALFAASAVAQSPARPDPPAMPTWLVPYPGASEQTKQSSVLVESTYTAPAAPHEILSHYRKLFASAGLPFEPVAMGYGFSIHGTPPDCDLTIRIQNRPPDSAVRVTCAAKLASTERMRQHRQEMDAERRADDPMKKYDTPVYPHNAAQPPLAWPGWLVRVDGAKLPVEKFPGRLTSSFTSQPTRDAIQAFYANLLNSHGYRVSQGLAAVPQKFGSWVMGRADPDSELGRTVVIRVQIRPTGQTFSVDVSVQ